MHWTDRQRSRHYSDDYALRPGTVTEIQGIIFQNDGQSTVGRMFIRPFEVVDRLISGIQPGPGDPPLAIHAGIRVVLDDQREYVVEQLVGSFNLDFRNGLNWTPLDKFRERDHGGWDVTVPAVAFRGVGPSTLRETLRNLNAIQGHPFLGEDCTALVERAFGGRRMFADSPLLRWVGLSVRVGDPALPLLDPSAQLDETARTHLQFDKIKQLPDAIADAESPNVRLWLHRLLPLAPVAAAATWVAYSSSSRKSTPVSSTARKFLR